jgi:hypothetical protein
MVGHVDITFWLTGTAAGTHDARQHGGPSANRAAPTPRAAARQPIQEHRARLRVVNCRDHCRSIIARHLRLVSYAPRGVVRGADATQSVTRTKCEEFTIFGSEHGEGPHCTAPHGDVETSMMLALGPLGDLRPPRCDNPPVHVSRNWLVLIVSTREIVAVWRHAPRGLMMTVDGLWNEVQDQL